MSPTRGFTLIELMVALGIVSLLTGMLMPVLNLAQRSAKSSNSRSVLAKIDIALRSFRLDAGALPFYATPAAGDDPSTGWDNELGFRLARTMSDSERTAMQVDLAAVGTAYATGGSAHITGAMVDQFDNVYTLRGSRWSDVAMRSAAAAVILNRMGAERARVAILSGNTAIRATVQNGGNPWTDAAGPLLTSPASRGWCDDYLSRDLPAKELQRDGDGEPAAILDLWGHPYVYYHPMINGVLGGTVQFTGFTGQVSGSDWSSWPKGHLSEAWFGLQPRPRAATTSLASDMRTTAAPSFTAEPELWSAGPDRTFDAMREHASNRDNLALTSYHRDLR